MKLKTHISFDNEVERIYFKSTPDEVVLAYAAAWTETDEEKRRTLLDMSWAENGIYTDPLGQVIGREALVQHIEGFHRGYVGNRIVLTSDIDVHHNALRFTWAMLNAEGERVSHGTDFGELGADGRLIRITGFFGLPRPMPASWPKNLVLPNE